jgi:hypothetical protein
MALGAMALGAMAMARASAGGGTTFSGTLAVPLQLLW